MAKSTVTAISADRPRPGRGGTRFGGGVEGGRARGAGPV